MWSYDDLAELQDNVQSLASDYPFLAAEASELARLIGDAMVDASPADDDEDEGSQNGDGFIVLDDGRYFVSLGREGDFTPGNQPRNGYPDPQMAAYELAGLMAEHRENPDSWMCGEHGPTERDYGPEVDPFLNDEGDGLRPLAGVTYEPGTEVRWDDCTWEVRRDYGELGVWLVIPVDPDAGRDHLVPHELTERADLLSEARGWIADCGLIRGEVADLSDSEVKRIVVSLYEGGWEQFILAYDAGQEQPS
jgi:hypothetical protein